MLALWLFCVLVLQQPGNDLSSGDLFLNGLVWAVVLWILFLKQKLGTVLCELVVNGGCRQGLMYPFSTSTALVSTLMRLPTVIWRLPWLSALVDQLLFALFRMAGLVPGCFLVEVVLLVSKHLG